MNYETKDYEVVQFKKGDFQDNYGNFWCDMVLRGIGEPVRIVVKDPTQYHDGMTLYGTIESKVSKAGKGYLRFKKVEKEETPPLSPTGGTTKKEWTPRDDESIKAQWAIRTAVEMFRNWNKERPELEEVEKTAKEFFSMIDRVKTPGPKIVDGMSAEQIASQFGNPDEVFNPGEEPISLSDIPF
jgi:hypothetical protein